MRWFAPERIRELAPSERGPAGAATFVSLEGLGRIPFSNIRRPKPLMDIGAGPGEQVSQPRSVQECAGHAVETQSAHAFLFLVGGHRR